MRKQLVSGKKLLLFVDTGDNCRCPLAIGYLSKLLAQKNIDYIEPRHMGVMTPNDLLPTPEVVQLLKEEGIDIRIHRSRPVNDDLIRAADLVLGFTAIHVQTCLRRVPESKGKVFLLKQYVGLGSSGDQIHDPMGSTMEIFKKYFAEIKQALHKLVEMDFITTPPEPKEVLIAPTVSKPRSMSEEEAEDDAPRKPRARKQDAAAEESLVSSKARAAESADSDEDADKPVKAKKSSTSVKAKDAKAGKKADAAEGEKPAKTKTAKADADSGAAAKAEPKAGKAKAAKAADTEPVEKAKAGKKADKPAKADDTAAPAVKAKPAADKKASKASKAEETTAKAAKAPKKASK